MSSAIFGLVGVLLGAVAAGLGDYLLERRREGENARRAARMLKLELEEARDFVQESLEAMRWIAQPERVLSNDLWIEHRRDFAAIEDTSCWEMVSEAFIAIAGLRRHNLGADSGTRVDPGSERAEDAAGVLPSIERATEKLATVCG